MTLIVVAYDVNTETSAGRKRLRQIARVCENYGQRVQNSVFECWVDAAQWVQLRAELISKIALELDSLRFYFLGDNWKGRIEHVGAKAGYQPDGPLLI